MGDLTKRENRFFHGTPGNNIPANFPFQLNTTPAFMAANMILTGSRLGEDVILDNVLAFDLRVFDPLAQMLPDSKAAPSVQLTPSDLYYPKPQATPATAYSKEGGTLGAYVDLN